MAGTECMSTRNIRKKLEGYSMAAGAMALVSTGAYGAVQYSGLKNLPVHINNALPYVDINLDFIPDFAFQGESELRTRTGVTYGSQQSLYAYGLRTGFGLAGSGGGLIGGIKNFAEAESIDASNNFIRNKNELALISSGSFAYGYFEPGSDGYIGVRIVIDGEDHYGWIRFELGADYVSGIIKDWDYEDTPATAIKAGDGIPAESSSGGGSGGGCFVNTLLGSD